MSNLTNPNLINFLACPDCGNDVFEDNGFLVCQGCKVKYQIKNGIPLLYSKKTSLDHLKEEENLAEIMKKPNMTATEKFSQDQWDLSKKEFWQIVKNNIKPGSKTILNIGSGLDNNFVEFEKNGYTFINFDIVYSLLNTLQKDFGAKSCVAGDINALPFKKNAFNCITCVDVIHHEENQKQELLKSISGLLKDNGTIFLEDPNAWALFKIPQSLLLPRGLYIFLRSLYHKLAKPSHAPANYEFHISVWKIIKILKDLGLKNVKVYSNEAYPTIGKAKYKIYRFLADKFEVLKKYHNFHFLISAEK